MQADAARRTLTVAATDTRSSIAVGGQLGVYHGDELALQGLTAITAAKQAWQSLPTPIIPPCRSQNRYLTQAEIGMPI